MRRRTFLKLATVAGTANITLPTLSQAKPVKAKDRPAPIPVKDFELNEITLDALQKGLEKGKYSAVDLVKKYLSRIEDIDQQGPNLNAVVELNPDALAIAAALDKERKAKGPRGPLHGIPILLKDNIDTHDRLTTTAGSLALEGSIAPQDSFVAQRLRQAGAVILGKTNLSEWANFRGSKSTSGWSGRGGQTRNPYALDRNPSGSSSGSAVAVSASLCPVAIGTETDGSIVSPSSYNGIVGIKPTVGLVSRAGIIPISHTQDTAGPMARTVRDAAILLGALAGVDPRDSRTGVPERLASPDYTQFLEPNGLRGARLGVPRKLFGSNKVQEKLINQLLEAMKKEGAVIVDPADLPSDGKFGGNEYQIMLYEFKAGLNAYLATLGPSAPVKSLKEIIEFNEKHGDQELRWFGQESMLAAEAKGPLTDKAYLDAVATCRRLSQEGGIDAIMDQHKLDALVAPTTGPAHVTDYIYGDRGSGGSTWPAAVAGYPSITVPATQIHGLPVGLSFFGRAWSEPKLLRIAYSFEQMTKGRKPPGYWPNLQSFDPERPYDGRG
ncbi:MAG TPA: amidase [Candidatus Saccharimonadales bacterium]|nr:amidase [Candidatus Saccharimonadales bacterium]